MFGVLLCMKYHIPTYLIESYQIAQVISLLSDFLKFGNKSFIWLNGYMNKRSLKSSIHLHHLEIF